jgi:glycoprotein 2-beta-D-xylosyltransferase
VTLAERVAARHFRWLRRWRRATADGRLATYAGELAVLRDVVVDFSRCTGRLGGEPLDEVALLTERDEHYRFHPGFLRLPGTRLPALPWRRPRLDRAELQDVLATLCTDGEVAAGSPDPTPHLLVVRFEYANFFHTVTDWYNVFLAQRFLGLPTARVVLADGHPATPLDEAWRTLFGDVRRIGALPRAAGRLQTLVLTTLGWDSPLLDFDAWALPLAEDFRRFVLGAHGLPADAPRAHGPLRITLVLREDYRAHAHSVRGSVQRKFANARALEAALAAMPGVTVRAVALEQLGVQEQLALSVETDVLVGMHGAGLTHTLFLPPWAGVLELYPAYASTRRRHFRRLAGWRGLAYRRWRNTERAREHPDHRTEIPPAVLVEEVRRLSARVDA